MALLAQFCQMQHGGKDTKYATSSNEVKPLTDLHSFYSVQDAINGQFHRRHVLRQPTHSAILSLKHRYDVASIWSARNKGRIVRKVGKDGLTRLSIAIFLLSNARQPK